MRVIKFMKIAGSFFLLNFDLASEIFLREKKVNRIIRAKRGKVGGNLRYSTDDLSRLLAVY